MSISLCIEGELNQLPQESYDTQGQADINTPEFKEWFGDSKVVDENGKPLVVYHGSPNKGIQIFDKNRIGNRDNGFFGKGFYFTPKDYIAEGYTNTNDIYPDFNNQGNEGEVYPVYLAVENPKYVRDIAEGTIDTEELIQQGYDGVIVYSFEEYPESVRESDPYVKETIEEAKGYKNTWWQLKTFDDEVIGRKYIDEIIVFEPEQIKSVYNRGSWDARNDNIYYQRAYAGSRVDYDKPSLEAIGSGEGNQAHGWGLYYALDKDVAEKYRKSFTNYNIKEQYKGKEVVDWYNEDTITFAALRKIIDNNMDKEEALRNQELIIDKSSDTSAVYYDEDILAEQKAILQRIEEINVDDIVIEKPKGQVHEVEIPENPYLLDEQLEFNEQSEYVKEKLRELLHDNIFSEYVEEGQTLDDFVEKEITDWELGFTGGNIYDRLSNLLGSDQSASSFLERYGIKGITYDGRQDGRAFVIFNPDDVEVIQKFYQLPQDDLNNVIDGHEVIDGFDENASNDAFVRTKEGRVEHGYITDELAKQIGSSKGGEIRLYNDLDKHIDKGRKKYILSQGYADLIDFVDDTISNWEKIYKGSDKSFLITKSKNKDNIVAVKLERDGKYYKISTAFIGRNGYLKNKKALAERAATNQLLTKSPDAFSGASAINNITLTRGNVKPDYQNKPQPKGLYDAKKGVIKIFESADFSTLPHELAHYWLDNMWHYVRSGNASEKYRQRWNVIANWLNVKQEQAFLTRGQQEKFARGYEQYLLNGNLPTPIIKGAFDDYDRWLKRVYGDMNRLNVRHIDYKKASR